MYLLFLKLPSQAIPLSPCLTPDCLDRKQGKKVKLESDSAREPGLAQINRAEALPSQFQQCLPNLTSSALRLGCHFALVQQQQTHCLSAVKNNVYKALRIAQQKKILHNGLSSLNQS